MAKIRSGFVSNSSSSSFLIKLPKPISEINLKEFKSLVGDIHIGSEWKSLQNKTYCEWSVDRCVNQLYSDILKPSSKPDKNDIWSEYFYEDLGRDLEETEYVVEYSDNEDYFEYLMEDIFMPQVDLVTRTFSWH